MESIRPVDGRRITIYDIAREAGVSPSTVSRVLNNTVGVRKDKREMVQAIISKHDFRPNALARSLSETNRRTIGIIMPDVRNFYYANLFVACEQAARRRGYSLLLENSLSMLENELEQLTLMEEQRVSAIILAGGRVDDLSSDETFVEKVNQVANTIPVIITGKLDGTSCHQVRIDAIMAMELIMEHLISLEHRDIAILGGYNSVASSFEKRQCYKQLLSRHQIPYHSEFCDTFGGYDYETGYTWMNELFSRDTVPTAVIGINDYATLGAMKSILEHGLHIPDDISVVGFDNINICDIMNPGLTSVDYNYDEFAEKLVDTAIACTENVSVPVLQLIASELILRDSTGPAKK